MQDQIKQIYDNMGESYTTKAEKNWENKDKIDKFLNLIEGENILDIGCGTGELLSYCSNQGFKVTGIDISKEMLKVALAKVNNAMLHEMSVYDLNQLQDKYDGVLATYLFVHIPKDKINDVIKSMYNLLKDDGIFFITFTYAQKTNEFMVNYTLDEITKLLTSNNFEVLETSEINEALYTCTVISKKHKTYNS